MHSRDGERGNVINLNACASHGGSEANSYRCTYLGLFFFFGHPGMEGTALDMFYRSIHQSKEESIDAIVDVDAAAAVGGAAAVVCNVML